MCIALLSFAYLYPPLPHTLYRNGNTLTFFIDEIVRYIMFSFHSNINQQLYRFTILLSCIYPPPSPPQTGICIYT